MAVTMTSYSTATLSAKSIEQIVHLQYNIERFARAFAGKVYEQMVALIQSRSLKLHYQNFENLSIQ